MVLLFSAAISHARGVVRLAGAELEPCPARERGGRGSGCGLRWFEEGRIRGKEVFFAYFAFFFFLLILLIKLYSYRIAKSLSLPFHGCSSCSGDGGG